MEWCHAGVNRDDVGMLVQKKGLSSPSGSAWRTENKTAGGKTREVKSLPGKATHESQVEVGQKSGGWHWNLPGDMKRETETILVKSQRTG